jgi:hypothetical protein
LAPQLESLDERLNLSAATMDLGSVLSAGREFGDTATYSWAYLLCRVDRDTPVDPVTMQTRQVSIIQDLAPPDPDLNVSAALAPIPSVTDLVSDSYNGRSAVAGDSIAGRVTAVVVDPSPVAGEAHILEGHHCLVFYLGGIPSSEPVPQYWVFGTELPPDANAQVRHRTFPVVDRSQVVLSPLADLASPLSGDDSESLRRRNQVTTLSMDVGRAGSVAQVQGALFITKQRASPSADEGRVGPFFNFQGRRLDPSAADGAPGPSILLRRLANPSLPDGGTYAGTHILYQDIFIPAATGEGAGPYVFAQDGRATGASTDSYYGTGVYKSVDSGRTW